MKSDLATIAICFLAVVTYALGGNATGASPSTSPSTSCQARRSKAFARCYPNGRPKLGCYIPHCNPDGSFPAEQCGIGGYCHCEDEQGNVINGTSRPPWGPRLDCDSVRANLTASKRASGWAKVSNPLRGYCPVMSGCAIYNTPRSGQCCPPCRRNISACANVYCPPVDGCVRYAQQPLKGRCCRRCIQLKPNFSSSCGSVTCPQYQECVKRASTGKVFCRCKRCYRVRFQFILATDGRYYRSLCHLQQAACLSCKKIYPSRLWWRASRIPPAATWSRVSKGTEYGRVQYWG